jgi:hypothetical protein
MMGMALQEKRLLKRQMTVSEVISINTLKNAKN